MTVLPLETGDAPLEVVGGKGVRLTRLSRAGFPVPGGFILTSSAYERFVDSNRLRATLRELARPALDAEGGGSFERASSRIRERFENAALPADAAAELGRAYRRLGAGEPAVAVRSSATAEDLPGLSFAGLYETFLNVRGEDAVLSAVRRCWASLWTARALGYRRRMGIHREPSMAVVVQRMVDAEVSGVLFTANPVTGERSEAVVNAGYGLGEAIVGGRVTPDAYVVDRGALAVRETTVGPKERMAVAAESGTRLVPVDPARRGEPSLPAPLVEEIVRLGVAAERLLEGAPQDIEWAVAGGKPWLLQSRPITRLPPEPLPDVRWEPPEPDAVLKRIQIVEYVLDPVSKLFEDVYLTEACREPWARWFIRARGVDPLRDGVPSARLLTHVTVNGFAYRRFGVWSRLREEGAAPSRDGRLSRWREKARRGFALYFRLVSRWRRKALPAYLAAIEEWAQVAPGDADDETLLSGIRALARADASYWYDGAYLAIIHARRREYWLRRFLQENAADADLANAGFLGAPRSPAMRARAELRALAEEVRASAALRGLALATPVERLREALRNHADGAAASAALDGYIRRYGHQVYTLDFVEPAMAEDPAQVLQTLQRLVRGPERGPHAQDRTPAVPAARDAGTAFRGFRRWRLRHRAWLARRSHSYREEALFFMGAAWSVLRPLALELGRRLVEAGTLAAPADAFHLTGGELAAASEARRQGRALPRLLRTAERRRALREARKSLRPPHAIGPEDRDAPAATEPDADRGRVLRGSPVSPGRVTGEACVIRSRTDFHKMKPNCILVCPNIAPAWMQLFDQAIGLVTDIGGPLAHGSMLTREYGIPAVMGVDDATKRIASGHRITIDGHRGTVALLSSAGGGFPETCDGVESHGPE